jgi:hypothetical protein
MVSRECSRRVDRVTIVSEADSRSQDRVGPLNVVVERGLEGQSIAEARWERTVPRQGY